MVKSVTITEDDYKLMTLIGYEDAVEFGDAWFAFLDNLFNDKEVEYSDETNKNIIWAAVTSIRNRGGVVREDD